MAQSISISNSTQTVTGRPGLKPLPLGQALFYFGLPALGFRLAFYNGLPWLLAWGFTPFQAFAVTVTVPTAALLGLALAFFKWEGHPFTWPALAARFRLKPLTGKDWLWTLGGLGVGYLGGGMLGFTARAILAALPALNPPDFFPAILNPNVTLSAQVFADYVAEPVRGNWGLVGLQLMALFFNIFGEEFWWRGVILPRQELVHGRSRSAWIVHGLLWTLFHVPFYPWQLFALMPICLGLAFVCQKTRNNVPGLVMHWAYNGTSLVLIVLGVSGLLG